MTARIQWIDLTKGLLIVLMVIGHICNIAESCGINCQYLAPCLFYSSLYTCFFMQAFMILTGYTSNFRKNLRTYCTGLLKSILVPWILFSLISQVFRVLFCGSDYFFLKVENQNFFFLIEDFWFLQVMFFSKVIYYFIHKYIKSDIIRAVLLLTFMILGFKLISDSQINGVAYHYNNYIHYKDLLCMLFFIWFGDFCRRLDIFNRLNGKILVIIICIYLSGHFIRLIMRIADVEELFIAPVILSHGSNIKYIFQILPFLFYTLLGSLSLFGIMRLKLFEKCRVLEYLGKNSLAIYCIHFIIMTGIILFLKPLFTPNSIANAIVYMVIVFSTTILFSSSFIKLTSKKPFNYFVGKF